MKLTVSELARAVNKNEAYVRQHMRRGHIKTVKVGRNVFVESGDAARWAVDRGLPFDLPNRPTISVDSARDRVARVAVLSWHPKDGEPINLFTHIRHRRKDALGPWTKEPDEKWTTTALTMADDANPGEIRLHCKDMPFQRCQELIDDVLARGFINASDSEASDSEIRYELVETPRRHWAYRDERRGIEPTITSPFYKHSAHVVEFWRFSEEARELWLDVVASRQNDLQPLLAKLRFPLDRLCDRVGNFLISEALDWVNCDLAVRRNKALTLIADGDELTPGAYTAEVWACHSGDDVLRRTVPINQAETVLELHSDIDRIGFSLHRNRDGLCVDRLDSNLIMESSIAMNFSGGPTVQLRDDDNSPIATVAGFSERSMISVAADRDSPELDKAIRREVLYRRLRELESAASREGNFKRFEPAEFSEAVEYFISLLHRHSYLNDPLYLADPYFTQRESGKTEDKLYLGIFDATRGSPLRILCGGDHQQTWWSNYPAFLKNHVEVKACTKWIANQGKHEPAFHDRYLVTQEGEFVITNSFNGWSKHGVTFVKLPYGVYRADAERFWSMGVGTSSAGIRITEVK